MLAKEEMMRFTYKGISINTSKNTHEKVFSLIDKKKSSTVLDIPCGSGAFILRLTDEGFMNVIGVDLNNNLEFDHNQLICGDMEEILPIEDNSIDLVVCIDGIEHIDKQLQFIQEVNRILNNNGEFIISTPNITSLRSRFKWLLTGHHHKCEVPLDEKNPTPLHHIGMVSFPELRYMLHTNGFIIDKVITNRIKTISWIYVFLIPFVFLNTSFKYFKCGIKKGNLSMNKEIFRVMFTKSVLFGETLIVKSIKINGALRQKI